MRLPGQERSLIFSSLSLSKMKALSIVKYCLSAGDSFGGLSGLTWLFGVSLSLYLLIFFGAFILESGLSYLTS